jgi:drug/metabolite transporter (DMT)-like permease
MLCFSFTLPATRLAVPAFGSLTVGFGRAALAGLLALGVLLVRRERLPDRRHWLGLGVVALGTVFGFSIFTSLALRTVPSAHGAVVVGLLPAATAVAAVLLARERPRPAFWAVCALGVLAVLGFAAVQGAGQLAQGDLYLGLAVIFAAAGYAEGGRLARTMDGWRVVSWALVGALPLTLLAAWLSPWPTQPPPAAAWWALGYVSVVSMYLGFFAWYRGLALGGVAQAGQVQLLQPVLTLAWSAALLGESLTPLTVAAALLVVACALLSRLTR